jgi:hypothetical protein
MFVFACPIIAKSQCWLFVLRTNTGQISVFALIYPYLTLETVKSTHAVDIWMEIPIQHDVYISANYSVSSYLNFIPICWNVLIWLKYDFRTKSTLLRIYLSNLSVQRSFLQYKSQCLEKVNVKYVIKRSWHEIFHNIPGINWNIVESGVKQHNPPSHIQVIWRLT